MIKSTLEDLFNFIKKPDDRQISISNYGKLKFILILLAFNLAINIVVILPLLSTIDEFVPLDSKQSTYISLARIIIVTIILMPFLEELFFRYFLRYVGANTFIFKLKRWKRMFPFLVYSSTIVFSLLHANNYVGDTLPFLLLSPLIVLTQFVSGIMMAYIRIRINFFTGVFFHSLWNFLVVIAIPSMQFYLSDPYIKQSKEYKISIEEKPFFNQDERLIKIDSIDGKFHSVKSFQYTIDDLADTLGIKVPYRYGDVIVNLKFHSEGGISKNAFLDLLERYDDD